MNEDEQAISKLLVAAHSGFNSLPPRRDDEMGEVVDAIHTLQRLLCMRVVARDYPGQWTASKEFCKAYGVENGNPSKNNH